MTPWLDDGDVRLYHGDALTVLRELPDESVDCVVTSPPYWGLRDYGTAEWVEGDPDCDHQQQRSTYNQGFNERWGQGAGQKKQETKSDRQYPRVCAKCGAVRIDAQLGLEPTPDLFVHNMVELFREFRRVLAPHGTCWVNLGDSYASSPPGNKGTPDEAYKSSGLAGAKAGSRYMETLASSVGQKRNTVVGGLKPKDLVGIPWRVAFALQADGWYLRSDIVWSKPNPMPESVTDRPTKAHEFVFLLTKAPRYWFDAEAVRERYVEGVDPRGFRHDNYVHDEHHPTRGRGPDGRKVTKVEGREGSEQHRNGERWPNPAGRNVRSVWTIATQPYPEAHFATFPEELARRCILAGCPVRVCRVCGKPSERIVERESAPREVMTQRNAPVDGYVGSGRARVDGELLGKGQKLQRWRDEHPPETVGWSDCGHNNWRPGIVLDPFIGSGTTAKVARDHQRHAIGIDLSQQYLELAARRLQQLSLLAGETT